MTDRARKRLTKPWLKLLIVSFVGWIATMCLDAFVLDDFHAYGEVPIPGTQTLHMPEGDVNAGEHAVQPREGRRHLLALGLPQARRVLDVGQQQRHRFGR